MRFVFVPLLAAALAALSGCGNSSPAEPQTAWSLQLEQTDPTACTIADNAGNMGTLTDNSFGSLATNGVGMASVQCSVVGSGSGPYSVSATAMQGQYTFLVDIASISATATQAAPATGSVTYESLATTVPYASNDCQFFFTSGTKEAVAAGRIWMSFSCAEVSNGPAMSMCPLSNGLALFESCETVASGN